ncbi:MAG TPA: glycosyltransferase [Candidatus Hydrogenedentes bacterium]|nr:glycosyltransferase [Candidatus Hydrogenedentota bacterium]
MEQAPKYSFVLPVYNEAENVEPMMERLATAGAKLDAPFEVVWVNDGSTDATEAILEKIAAAQSNVRTLHLSRNFGHMAALCAGLESARATHAVITLDGDGQHPPERIPEMVRLWQEGADIVQTVRSDSGDLGPTKRVTSRWFYKVFNVLADTDIPEGAADFRLLDREVVDALNNLPERARFVRGLVHWVGFNKVLLPYAPESRLSGETKYSLLRMMAFALSGITSFSVRPLRLAFVLTLLVVALVVVYLGYVLVAMSSGKYLTPGWTSTMFIILLLGAAQLLVIGIASEYLARMYVEQKQRPVYIVRKRKTSRE